MPMRTNRYIVMTTDEVPKTPVFFGTVKHNQPLTAGDLRRRRDLNHKNITNNSTPIPDELVQKLNFDNIKVIINAKTEEKRSTISENDPVRKTINFAN